MESNGTWGELASQDDELANLWDSYATLPEPGEHEALDAFVERKNLTIPDLVRVGARLTDPTGFVLVYGGPGYLKFRNVVTDVRWNYVGSSFDVLKVVGHRPTPSDHVLVAEGETDAAWLLAHYDCDVAVLAAGAGTFKSSYATVLSSYKQVLVALDTDAAGERGAAAILQRLPNAVRFAPEGNDWCSANTAPPLPDPDEIKVENQLLVPAGVLLDMEPPAIISWYEGALLPVGGQMILHGWAKSFKSFLAMDIMAMLAQGAPWCHFEPTEEACNVAVLQYEIPWAYYQQRLRLLDSHATNKDSFRSNFQTFTPLIRPRFVAGDTAQEDILLRALDESQSQVFLLDPIRRATGAADLNSEKEVRPVLNFAQRVQELGVTVILTHHDNKASSRAGGGDPLGMTGAGAFAGDADTIVSVSIPQGATIDDPVRNLRFTLRNAPAPGLRSMEMTEGGLLVYSTTAADYQQEDEHGATQPSI